MEYAEKNLDWNGNAGQRLDELARALPRSPRLELTVFGSAPLQLLVERTFLSEDIDISPTEDAYDLVAKIVTRRISCRNFSPTPSPMKFMNFFIWQSVSV
ncbi:MAG TPA: hypothetical protein VIK59_12725 [Verrucomicrobiae bacterium]